MEETDQVPQTFVPAEGWFGGRGLSGDGGNGANRPRMTLAHQNNLPLGGTFLEIGKLFFCSD